MNPFLWALGVGQNPSRTDEITSYANGVDMKYINVYSTGRFKAQSSDLFSEEIGQSKISEVFYSRKIYNTLNK